MDADEELEQFRRQWKKELLSGGAVASTAAAPTAATPATGAAAGALPTADASNSNSNSNITHLLDSTSLEGSGGGSAPYRALFAYTRAVLAERKHDLNTAVEAYKRAFRLHDKPDKLYHRACALLLDSAAEPGSGAPGAADKGKGKGKGKAHTLVNVEGVEITTLLDEPLAALLRASLEPSADGDNDGSATNRGHARAGAGGKAAAAPVKAVVSPRTSPTAATKALPETGAGAIVPGREAPLPSGPLLASSTTAPGAAAVTEPVPADRYLPHHKRRASVRPAAFAFQLPPVKSVNTLQPLLDRLLTEPRPDRETMLQRSRQTDGTSKMVITSGTGKGGKEKAAAKAEAAAPISTPAPAPAPAPAPPSAATHAGATKPPTNARSLIFHPLDEEAPCHLARLPDEILLAIVEEVARPRGRRGEKIPLPIGLHSVPGAPILGGGGAATGGGKEASAAHHGAESKSGPKHGPHDAAAQAPAANGTAAGAHASSTSAHPHGAQGHGHAHAHPLGLAVNLALPDVPSLEALGRTCAKWRVLTSGAKAWGAGGDGWGVWRLCVRATLVPPLLPRALLRAAPAPAPAPAPAEQEERLLRALYDAHSADWRTLYAEHPRVRLNGCYIASCRYTRAGLSEENVWISVVHVVEFFRSIRLLPDGTCLSLLATEPPAETVRRMEPGWKRKGLCVGRWRLFPFGLPEAQERLARRRARGRAWRAAGAGQMLGGGSGGEGPGPSSGEAGAVLDEDALVAGMEDVLLEDVYGEAGAGMVVGAEGTSSNEDEDVFYEYDTEDELDAIRPRPPFTTTTTTSKSGTAAAPHQPKLVLTDLRDRTLPKYAFRMVFALKSGGRGRWNRLELETYESVNLGNGERLALPLTHTKPFVFSVVRSYGVG